MTRTDKLVAAHWGVARVRMTDGRPALVPIVEDMRPSERMADYLAGRDGAERLLAPKVREGYLRACREGRDPALTREGRGREAFVEVEWEEALELAKDSGTLFKAQVMRVLWQYGLADGMYNTVYKSLFGLKPVRGRILHTPRYEPVDTVLDVIKASRAVVVLAHPSVYHSMELARELIAAGRLDGVEIDHPRNTEEDKAEMLRLAEKYDLAVTGGTDYHGFYTTKKNPVGTFTTAESEFDKLFSE